LEFPLPFGERIKVRGRIEGVVSGLNGLEKIILV
jgi:hypothetical protein